MMHKALLGMTRVLLTLMLCLDDRGKDSRSGRDDRGDVPGWVLITVMTAGIVTVIWQVAGPTLVSMLQGALQGVSGPGG